MTRVHPSRSQASTDLALSAAPISVGVVRRQFMTPLASCLASVLRSERPATRPVRPVTARLPVRRVVAGAMLTRVTARTQRVTVMARVIYCLARIQRTYELAEPVAVCLHARTPADGKRAVVFLIAACRPRPAVVWSSLIHLRQVQLKPCAPGLHAFDVTASNGAGTEVMPMLLSDRALVRNV